MTQRPTPRTEQRSLRQTPRSRRGLRCILIALLLAAGCSGGGTDAAPSPPPGAADPLREIAREKGTVQVIVDLAVEPKPDGTWDRRAIATAQRKLLEDLGEGATVAAHYDRRPQMTLAVDARALKKLRVSPLVAAIHLDEKDDATE